MYCQIPRSCFNFLKRHGKISNYKEMHNLYIKNTDDTSFSFSQLEHCLVRQKSSKYRKPPEKFKNWCEEIFIRYDNDLAQHFTTGNHWLTSNIKEFILEHVNKGILDPFAGNCDLKKTLEDIGIKDFIGYDIDKTKCCDFVKKNDSLINIPKSDRLIVTNPPYMAKYTATRYGSLFTKYFEKFEKYNNIYLLALERCLESHDFVVIIIPETFLLTNCLKSRLYSITIIEDQMFGNTSFPVLVACFTKNKNSPDKIKIYKNRDYLFTMKELFSRQKKPIKSIDIKFNKKNGNIGLRAIDSATGDKKIMFCHPIDLNYSTKGIKHSSRLMSIISIPSLPEKNIDSFLVKCNKILLEYRHSTFDLLMAPFKGNDKTGVRRRRLDFRTARAIMEASFY